ncbi:hypothetical protein CWO07_13740 [Vibrio splendidus]|uniref:Uncharacterized protein n=1 Tax=Vibrio splendidus TaxID=29497 RepID=A0A2T5EUF0_VIBSP|nr:hypothetical protein [Vibrio splendidus]PTP33620.1 hypothetical protein CWO07_13740 [Vibrio splendidus]
MDTKLLDKYPNISNVLSEHFKDNYLKIGSVINSQILMLYSVFVDISSIDDIHVQDDRQIRLLNSEKTFVQTYQQFIGFIYTELDKLKLVSKSALGLAAKKAFMHIAQTSGFVGVSYPKLSRDSLSEDAQRCIDLYLEMPRSEVKREFYQGWTATDRDGEIHNVHMARIYSVYGRDLTNRIYERIGHGVGKRMTTTASNVCKLMVLLWEDLAVLYPTEKALWNAMSQTNVNRTFVNLLNYRISQTVLKKNSIKILVGRSWTSYLNYFSELFFDIDGWFEEPPFPLIRPKYKSPDNLTKTLAAGLSKEANEKLFVDIPLSIKDDEVLDILTKRVRNSIEHTGAVNELLMSEIMDVHNHNNEIINEGAVRPYDHPVYENFQDIGKNNVATTLATFQEYGFAPERTDYIDFLGYDGESKLLANDLNLLTQARLLPFLLQLVIIHPKITPSWFYNWKLYDQFGDMVGYTMAGDSYTITSFKPRKGKPNAQQTIVLNPESKVIVENIITLTSRARQSLKQKNDVNWRYTLLTESSVNVNPIRVKRIKSDTDSDNNRAYYERLEQEVLRDGCAILPKSETELLRSSVNLRSARSTKALLVYLETLSLAAMAEALGHKGVKKDLLDSYMPKEILEFFNNRWIRIFQQALLYEAMKDSKCLYKAVDFKSAKELEQFLDNHGLGELPEHLLRGKKVAEDIRKEPKDICNLDAVLALSVPVLQVLIAIKDIVENSDKNETLPPIFGHWYFTAVLILKHLDLSRTKGVKRKIATASQEVLDMFAVAEKKPLDKHKLIMGATG